MVNVNNISKLGEAMSTRHTYRRPTPIRTRATLATAVIAALTIAAPAAAASAATPPAVISPVRSAAIAPILSGDAFNGHTAIVSSPVSTVVTVVGSHSPATSR
jgi:hypothetical protein